jgi:competence transcription factor ComK
MINFTGGLIRNPIMNSYINPNKVVNFSEYEGATIVEFDNGKTCELEDVTAESFANAFTRAQQSNLTVDILA